MHTPDLKIAGNRNKVDINHKFLDLEIKPLYKGKKYFLRTYGCQMNVHESEKIAAILEGLGYEACEKREDADIIVFNTCAIREGAEDRVFGNVGNLKKQKKRNIQSC